MTGRIPARAAKLAATILATTAVLAVAAGAASASGTVIYSNIPSPLPGNVPSVGFEATSASEFGGQVELAGASATKTTVTVGMSSWACESGGAEDGTCVTAKGAKFSWPVTLHVYTVGNDNAVGTQIAGLTKTFKMPYRPSANLTKCPGNGGWYRMGNCFHGKLFKLNFALKGVTLPKKAIISVSYNTTDYGEEPSGVPGPYDSLNVGTTGDNPSTGAYPIPNDAYYNTTFAGFYCDGGAGGTGTFRLDSGCWTGTQPTIQVATG